MLEPERVVAISAVCRPPARLHICGVPGLRAERAQERRGVESASADFHVVGLKQHATLLRPVALQRQDHVLERLRQDFDDSRHAIRVRRKTAKYSGRATPHSDRRRRSRCSRAAAGSSGVRRYGPPQVLPALSAADATASPATEPAATTADAALPTAAPPAKTPTAPAAMLVGRTTASKYRVSPAATSRGSLQVPQNRLSADISRTVSPAGTSSIRKPP